MRLLTNETPEIMRCLAYQLSGSLSFAEESYLHFKSRQTGFESASSQGNSFELHGIGELLDELLASLKNAPRRELPVRTGCGMLADMACHETNKHIEPFPDLLYPDSLIDMDSTYGGGLQISIHLISFLQSVPLEDRVVFVLIELSGFSIENVSRFLRSNENDIRLRLDSVKKQLSSKRFSVGAGPEKGSETLMPYIFAWETADTKALGSLLEEDFLWQSIPSMSLLRGRDVFLCRFSEPDFVAGAGAQIRMLPCRSNGQLSLGLYENKKDSYTFTAHSLQLLSFRGDLVSEVISFETPQAFGDFGLLDCLYVQGRGP